MYEINQTYKRADGTDWNSLRSGFLSTAQAYPDSLALSVRGTTLTYSELEFRSRAWAATLHQALGRFPSRVGVFGYRSLTTYIGTLASTMVGATFVPLNATFPPQRTAIMIREAALDCIIVDTLAEAQLQKVLSELDSQPLLMLPESRNSVPSSSSVVTQHHVLRDPLTQLPPIVPEDIAYLLFTSGSTGQPKGVPITHGSVMHFLEVMRKRYGIRPDDRLSQTFDQTFDLSVFDLFMAWHSGACVCGDRKSVV